MRRRRDSERQFPLVGAIGVSLGVHVALALLTLLAPLVSPSVALEEHEPPSEVTFSFVDVPDSPGEVPAVDVPPAGSAGDSAAVPLEPPALEEAPVEPLEQAAPAGTEEEEERAGEPDPPPLAETGAPTATAAESPRGARRRSSVTDALRDFGEALATRPVAPTSGSGNSEQNVFVPDLSSLPATGFGMGNLVFESPDYDWTDYGRQIYMAIWRAWHQRLWQTTDDFEKWAHGGGEWYLNHQTQVRFVIEQNGQVTGIAQEGVSGCPALDVSALDALAEVILPPLPRDFPRTTEVVHARFIAIGDVRAMRPQLGSMKAMGLF